MTLRLYWCTTQNGDADYWVVAETAVQAKLFFSGDHGFAYRDVRAERINMKLPGDLPGEENLFLNISPCEPTKEQLESWGVKYSLNFHVFSIGEKIYRPEGITRALMISNARAALRKRLRGQRTRTAFSF